MGRVTIHRTSRRGYDGIIAVSCCCHGAILIGITASGASVRRVTLCRTSRCGYDGIIVVSCCCHGAILIGITASGASMGRVTIHRTSRCGYNGFVAVAENGNRLGLCATTYCTSIGLNTFCSTGGSSCLLAAIPAVGNFACMLGVVVTYRITRIRPSVSVCINCNRLSLGLHGCPSLIGGKRCSISSDTPCRASGLSCHDIRDCGFDGFLIAAILGCTCSVSSTGFKVDPSVGHVTVSMFRKRNKFSLSFSARAFIIILSNTCAGRRNRVNQLKDMPCCSNRFGLSMAANGTSVSGFATFQTGRSCRNLRRILMTKRGNHLLCNCKGSTIGTLYA